MDEAELMLSRNLSRSVMPKHKKQVKIKGTQLQLGLLLLVGAAVAVAVIVNYVCCFCSSCYFCWLPLAAGCSRCFQGFTMLYLSAGSAPLPRPGGKKSQKHESRSQVYEYTMVYIHIS